MLKNNKNTINTSHGCHTESTFASIKNPYSPKISQTKLEGMAEFYGMTNEDATEYFKLHTEADIRHAAAWRNILETSTTSTEDLIKIADKSISAQNLLLDSCYEAYC